MDTGIQRKLESLVSDGSKTILEQLASLDAKLDKIDARLGDMVTKEYLKQELESLYADVATKESMQNLIRERLREDVEDDG